MTDDGAMESFGREMLESAERPLDDHDLALLAEVRRMYDEVDPAPVDLVERIQFALALDEVYAEVAHLTRMSDDGLAVRGDAVTGTLTSTLTFSAERLTAMVTVSRIGDRVRVDGWLAPPVDVEVRLRMQGERRVARPDVSGRFVFEDLPEGFAQLSFHPAAGSAAGDGAEGVIVTPLFQL